MREPICRRPWPTRKPAAGPDRLTAAARDGCAARPDRCVWGTNWPHPECHVPMPNDGELIDQFCDWVGDEATQRKILVENPARLYGFD